MGLCKCAKRKVTNQFCFEHRVNVCEYCLVSDHPKCVVKSYLHWLQDSDYNPICIICRDTLAVGDCVRLACYDVFHWDCLNQNALKLPQSSQPSEYTCMTCKTCVFPSEKLVSPVADALRRKLSMVAWGRRGLGLPVQQATVAPLTQSTAYSTRDSSLRPTPSTTPVKSGPPKVPTALASSTPFNTGAPSQTPATAIVSPQTTHVREKYQGEVASQGHSSHRVFDARKEDRIDMSHDHDENKYKRRGVTHWLGKLFQLNHSSKRQRLVDSSGPLTFKKVAVVFLILILGFMTVILVMTRVGRGIADDDPFLDPRANPNIKVQRT